MRIGYFSYEFPPDNGKGGIGTYVEQIAKAMAAAGFDVHVFAGSPQRELTEITAGYKVHWVKCNDLTAYKNRVVAIFEKHHSSFPFNFIESPEIGGNAWAVKNKFPKLPLVVRLHGSNYLVEKLKKSYVPVTAKLRFVLGALRRFTWDLGYWRKYIKEQDEDYQFVLTADYLTAPTEAMKQWAVENWHINPSKIFVLMNIFNAPKSFLEIPALKVPLQKQVVFFGRLNVLKGLVNATKAMKLILAQHPDWHFKVIGDDGPGPSNGTTMKSWMQQQLQDNIQRVTFVNGLQYELLPREISTASIVLLPSLFESFSYTCAEAMAAGKAIVGSKNGGMAVLIENEISGLLVNPKKPAEIHYAIKKLIEEEQGCCMLGSNARQHVLQDFDPQKTASQFVSYYQQVV